MVNVEAEVNKHKNKSRDLIEKQIQEYKYLAREHAQDIYTAGQYNMVAFKLQEIFDKLPAPRLKNVPGSGHDNIAVKTASISRDEKAKINAAWKKKAGSTR